MEQQVNNGRRNRRTRGQIENLLDQFGQSGVTVRQFCQQHNISTETFHKWQSRRKGSSLSKQQRRGFAPVVVASSQQDLVAEVKGIRLFQPGSAAYLKELLA